jgi:peptidoglycan/xylan/chitin deacetylase (PgdA/CDA1 family)
MPLVGRGRQMTAQRYRKLRRVISLVIGTAFYAVSSLWRRILVLCGKQPAATCVVIYYHAIKDEERQAFAHQMDTVRRLTTPIAIDPVMPLQAGKRYSAVTFDDGFENAIRNAIPELVKRDIPAAVFVTADLLGECAKWWPEPARERHELLATAERLRELPPGLICIGSHTLTHPRLPTLTEIDARRELSQSRMKLEELLNRRVTTFSFPFGAFNQALIDWCRDAGYERVFTTLPQMAFSTPTEFAVGRVSVEPSDWPLEFRLKLMGAYCWLPFAYSAKRVILSGLFGRKAGRLETGFSQS